MVDNYLLIHNILPITPEEDLTYFCGVIKRKKDNKNLVGKNNSSRSIRSYYLRCRKDLEEKWDEMKAISEVTNSRIMIDLFPKRSSKVKYEMLVALSEMIRSNQTEKLHRLYHSCYGKLKAEKGCALWLIDWDYKDTSKLDMVIDKYKAEFNVDIDVKYKIPTRQGMHYIVKPFNTFAIEDAFRMCNVEYPDIHKNSPTLLYLPKSID